MKKSELKALIRESIEQMVEGTTFKQLKVGDMFKLPDDPDDATLKKVSKTHYVVHDGPQGKGMKYGTKPTQPVTLVESEADYLFRVMAENMSASIAEVLTEQEKRWQLED